MMRRRPTRRRQGAGGGLIIRLLIGLAIAGFSFFSYLSSQEYNEVTGESQHITLSPKQEIALGLQSAPKMIQEFGGEYPDRQVQQAIDEIGQRLVQRSVASNTPWRFEFTVLNDNKTINAFALPGGQIFITTALLSKLDEEQAAGVLAHEIVHVLARHGAQRIAKSELTQGLVGAVGVASGSAGAQQTAAMVAQLVNMQYGRDDEIQSDTYGVCLMLDAGYDPSAMVGVMEILNAAAGGNRQPEFFSTHPNPENRIEKIQAAIARTGEYCPKKK